MKIPLTPDSILNTIEWWLKKRKLDYIKGNPKMIYTSSIKKFIESRTVNVKATNISTEGK